MTSASPLDEICRPLKQCRICGKKDLVRFLDLGPMLLVNRYLTSTDLHQPEPKFPLEILFCRSCFLSQLSVVISPQILYANYAYHSSISKTFQEHCEKMANDLARTLDLGEQDLILEIASNDGCLLSYFKTFGSKVLGVEPAHNLAQIAKSKGLRTITRFWDQSVADDVVMQYGKARLVLATNVLAHVDDLHGFLRAVASVLKPDGVFVFEVPYMVNFMNRAEFDTAYHEHLSYFLLHPLKIALEKNGFVLADVHEFEIHGGSIRLMATRGGSLPGTGAENIQRLLNWEEELGLHVESSYLRFASHVALLKEELTVFLRALKIRDKKIAAYGASAKGNVLLNYCGIGRDLLEYVVDDTPAKQGKFYPGNHLPIVSRTHLHDIPPHYLLLLAWNFVDEMVKNTAQFREKGGRYIVPIPSLRVI